MFGYEIKLSKYGDKFYDWKKEDIIILKKVPMYKISYNELAEIIIYYGTVTEEFYNSIKNYGNYVLLSDTKNNLIIKVDDNFNVDYIGWLDIKSDLDILEISYNLSLVKNIFVKNKRRINDYESNIRKEMVNEYQLLIKNKDVKKMEYLLYEWMNCENYSYDNMKELLLKKINGKVDDEYLRIYNLVKLSYNKV